MKKALLVTLALLLLISALSSCHKTPDSPIVVGKNQSDMLYAAEQASSLAVAEQVNAPQVYDAKIDGAGGKLAITARGVPVIVPEAATFPIVRVTAADFTQGQVDALLTAFLGDQTLYEVRYGVETRDEILQMILLYKQWKVSEEYASESDQRMIDDSIASLEAAYQDAPVTSEDDVTVSDGRLKLKEITGSEGGEHIAYYTGIRVTTNVEEPSKAAAFSVDNNSDLREAMLHRGIGQNGDVFSGEWLTPSFEASLIYSNPGDTYGSKFDHPFPVSEIAAIDSHEGAVKLTTTPAQAKKLVEQTLLAAGMRDIAVAGMYLVNDGSSGDSSAKAVPAEHYAYKLYLCRTVNGIPISYIGGMSGMDALDRAIKRGDSSAAEDAFSSAYLWYYETIDAMVDDTGILSFAWKSPLNIGETLVENAALLPFADASAIFEKMMKIKYEPRANDEGTKSFEVKIERVALEYQRVIEQNSNQNSLLVPMWNFYGTCTVTDTGGVAQSLYSGEEAYPFPLASINAVNGSMIDISKGY